MSPSSPSPLPRTVTELDHVRISNIAQRLTQQQASRIDDVIDTADLVPSREVPADVVTMYSQVVIADAAGVQRKLTLCYPADADPATGGVSVLSPVGTALLGLRVGAVVSWSTPDGRSESATLLEIVFQPEASGDYAK